MSEQENSRSPQSTTLPAEAVAGGSEKEPGVDSSCTGGSNSAISDTGMGNNVFTAPEKCSGEAGYTGEGKENGTESKADSEGQAKEEVCHQTHKGLPDPQDLNEREVPSGSADCEGKPTSDKGSCEEQEKNNKAEAKKSMGESESQVDGSVDCANNFDNCKGKEVDGEENGLGRGSEEKEETPESLSDEKDSSDVKRVEASEEREVYREGDRLNGAEKVPETTTSGVGDFVGSNINEYKPRPVTLANVLPSLPVQDGIQGAGENGTRALEAPASDHAHCIRDTDSEAGDSVCSEDGDHGEVCRGGGDCPHQGAEEGWEYVVDEEFNVPRRPVFNGSADHLERRSSLKRRASEEAEDAKPAKCRRGIQFEGVTVFYFPRSQGFTCVPSQGGSSLGMSRRHSHIRQFSLAEHAVEQRRAHREHLMRLRQQRSAREHGESSSRGSSSEDSEENSEEASDLSDSELDADSYYFLQPLPIRQRRALLRQAGICHIEGVEKEECKDIRISREMCGCQCKVYCDPDTCQCCQAGIKCQVDRHNFPCGCSREGCGNTYGRIEFNPIRVRTHFIHTLMRLEIEKRQSQQQHQHQQQQHQQQHQQHQQQQQEHHHHQQQQQEWQQQQQHQQQRAKWLASSSVPTNGFNGGGGGLGTGNLPFFEGGREAGSLAVTDVAKFNSSVEMSSCVGAMSTPLYPHFESRQMLGPAAPASVYIQHDTVGDYNSGTCSVFAGLGSPFDPSAPYGSCHSFPSSSVVAPQVVAPQVVAPQVVAPQVQPQVPPPQATPEAYNTLAKFTNTSSLVSTSFPYSGAVAPPAVPSAPVSCSYTQNTFCMAGVHDGAAPTAVFGQYPDPSASSQSLFKGGVSDCADFQPTFEAVSSPSSASADKSSRYLAAPSITVPGKTCAEYPVQSAASSATDCSARMEDGYEMDVPASPTALAAEDISRSESCLPAHSVVSPAHRGFDASLLSSSSADSGIAAGSEEPSEAAENLGEIVKKSMVETVSA